MRIDPKPLRAQKKIRTENIKAIYGLLAEGPRTRRELDGQLPISLMTISNIIAQLYMNDIVDITDAPREKAAGKQADLISLRYSEPVWFIIDLRKSRIAWSLFTPDRKTACSGSVAAGDYNNSIPDVLQDFKQKHLTDELWGAAVITPGPYDPEKDRISNLRLPQLNDYPIGKVFRKFLQVPCIIEEDAKLSAAACYEAFPGNPSMYYLVLGAGVGGAFVSEGTIIKGLNSMAGDPGQVPYKDSTFEALLSAEAFAEAVKGRSPEGVWEAVNEKARIARDLLETILWISDPHVIVLDCQYPGEYAGEFTNRVKELLADSNPLRKLPEIITPAFTQEPAYMGAIKSMENEWLTSLVFSKKI